MAKYFGLFVFAIIAPVALATEGFTECPGIPLPLSVNLVGCDKAPCILYRGGKADASITFISTEDSNKLETKARFREIASGVSGLFPLGDNGNTCNWLKGTDCPIYKGEETEYQLLMPVLTIYPKNLEIELEISVENENKKVLSCFKMMTVTSS